MDVHILSVGTSVIRNYCRGKSSSCPKQLVSRDWTPEVDEELKRSLKGKLCEFLDDVVQYVNKDPKGASAELNSFLSAMQDLYPKGQDVRVVLLCSDTFAGEIACATIKIYLDAKGYPTEALVVKELGRPKASSFYKGIANLACTLRYLMSDYENKYKDVDFYVSPTGGFKPESAFTYLTAMLSPKLKAVYYIREMSNELVLLPILPLSTMVGVKFDVPNVYKEKYGFDVEEVKRKLEKVFIEGKYDNDCWKTLSKEILDCITSHK